MRLRATRFRSTSSGGGLRSWSPLYLFSNGEKGAWYDPSDLSTLFQDAAGTTPVTGLEQPVGLMRDKSGLGSHAFQTVSASRPVLSARVNLFTASEFPNGVADLPTYGGSVTAAGASISGYANSISVQYNAAGSYAYKEFSSGILGQTYTLSVVVQMDDNGAPRVAVGTGSAGHDFTMVMYGSIGFTPTITKIGDSSYRISITGVCVAGSAFGVVKYSGQSARGFRVTAYDLRIASEGKNLPPYQRVNTATDYDTEGFPLYLRCDGVDDGMQTNSIDFTGTDKMTVWAGLRKLSRSSVAFLLELSAISVSNQGVFAVLTPTSALNGVSFRSGGASISDAASSTPGIGEGAVLAGIGDISSNLSALRLNGVQASSNAASQGAGNYGNYPLYLFRRGGNTLPFNGRFYGAIIRGRKSEDWQISAVENYLNQKTKAY